MIAKLRHKINLCSQKDVVVGSEIKLIREDILATWAMIEVKKGSMFVNGAAVRDNRNARTHCIYIRYRSDLEITGYAWIYEERHLSPPRWFKILTVQETESGGSPLYEFDCRIVERGDDLAEPVEEGSGPAVGLPHGVNL